MGVLLFLVLFSDLVSVFPEHAVIPFPDQEQRTGILFRNISERDLQNVRLHVESKHCTHRTEPEFLPRVRPSDRASFTLVLIRTPRTERRRFPLQLRLSSEHHPALRTFQLIADGRASAGDDQGWIDVGVVKVGGRTRTTRTLFFALLGVVPVVALLGLGWYFKRRARRA